MRSRLRRSLRPDRACFGAALSVLAGGAASATEAPWAPLIGAWRTTDYVSCGVDDVRAGRIVSVGENSMLIGFAHCSIESGATTGESTIRIEADCDLGGGYRTHLKYDWRMQADGFALLSQEGYETRLARCEGGVE